MAMWGVDLRACAEGTVSERFGRPVIRFGLDGRDMSNLRAALRFTAEMFFAAGARAVLPGVAGLPDRINPGDARLLANGPEDARAYSLITTHLFGTARMSVRPEAGVVGPDFAVHGTRNLFVVDSSVFPTNTGVNPQLSIMGVAMHAANMMLDRAT